VDRLRQLIERVLPIAVLVLALVGAPIMIFAPEGLPRLRGLERELSSVNEENKQLEREIEDLRGQVTRLRDDPAAVERIARDDLGLVRQSEVVFQFAGKRK
jgi:cell division protein FtsB